jgi:hypothetical protein
MELGQFRKGQYCGVLKKEEKRNDKKEIAG